MNFIFSKSQFLFLEVGPFCQDLQPIAQSCLWIFFYVCKVLQWYPPVSFMILGDLCLPFDLSVFIEICYNLIICKSAIAFRLVFSLYCFSLHSVSLISAHILIKPFLCLLWVYIILIFVVLRVVKIVYIFHHFQ